VNRETDGSWPKLGVVIAALTLLVTYLGIAASSGWFPFARPSPVPTGQDRGQFAVGSPSTAARTESATSTPRATATACVELPYQPVIAPSEAIVTPIDCADAGNLHSTGSTASHITFYNATNHTVDIYWINGNVDRQPYGLVPSHGSLGFNTFTDQYWEIDDGGSYLAVFPTRTYPVAAVVR
jgi:hypothetical protein